MFGYLDFYKTTRYNSKPWKAMGINKDVAIEIINRTWEGLVLIETGKYFSLLNIYLIKQNLLTKNRSPIL